MALVTMFLPFFDIVFVFDSWRVDKSEEDDEHGEEGREDKDEDDECEPVQFSAFSISFLMSIFEREVDMSVVC